MVFRRLSSDEISDIVAQAGSDVRRRSQTLRQQARVPSATGGGSSAASATRKLSGNVNLDALRAGREAERQDREVSGFGWVDTINDVLMGLNPQGQFIQDQTESFMADVMAPMPKDETPQNAAQGFVNALGTGLYASARVGEEAIRTGMRIGSKLNEEGGPDIGGAIEQGIRGIGSSILGDAVVGGELGGAARGVLEGFGQRFNGERPKTMGQNLQTLGINDAIRAGTGTLGATETGGAFFDNQNTYVGLAGLAADIAGDPLTYAGGVGLLRYLRGATQGGRAAVAAGSGPIGVIRNAAREGASQRTAWLAQRAQDTAERSANRRLRENVQGVAFEDYQGNVLAAVARDTAREAERNASGAGRVEIIGMDEAVATPTSRPEAATDAPEAPTLAGLDSTARSLTTKDTLAAEPKTVLQQSIERVTREGFDPAPLQRIAQALQKKPKVAASEELPKLDRAAAQRAIQDDAEGIAPERPLQPQGSTAITKVVNDEIAALRATPEGAALLRQEVFTGQPLSPNSSMLQATNGRVTLESALRASAFDAKLRTKLAGELAPYADSLPARAGAAVDEITPAALGRTIIAAIGKSAAKKYNMNTLAADLRRMDNDTDRLRVLAQVLKQPGRKLKSFEDAMSAAMAGQVSASNMRIMLRELGITVKGSSPKLLRETLSGQGVKRWQELKSSTPTEREVLEAHNVDDELAVTADEIDLDAMQTAQRETAEALSADILGSPTAAQEMWMFGAVVDERLVDEFAAGARATDAPNLNDVVLRNAETGDPSSLAAAAYRAAAEAGRKFESALSKTFKPLYNQEEWLAMHRAAVGAIKSVANSKRYTGDTRGAFLYGRYLDAMRLATARMISEGRIPRLQHMRTFKNADGETTRTVLEDPVFLSVDQILDFLPPQLGQRALFDLDYRLSDPGKGMTAEAQSGFSAGLTVYPTSLATGARTAMRGGTAAEIYAAMRKNGRPSSAYETSDAGQAVMRSIAEHMAAPEMRQGMRLLNDAQELAYVALAKAEAGTVVRQFAAQIIRAIARRGILQGDRGPVFAEITYAIEQMAAKGDGALNSLAQDLGNERMANGVLQLLGEPGSMLMRHDARMANIGSRTPAQRAEAARAASKPGFVAPRTDASKKLQEEYVREANRARTQSTTEMRPLAADATTLSIARGEAEATDVGFWETYSQKMAEIPLWQVFGRAGFNIVHDWGQVFTKPLQASATQGAYTSTDEFIRGMRTWIFGGRTRTLGDRHLGLQTRLQAELNLPQKASLEQVNAQIAGWWEALAAHGSRLQDELGAGAHISDEMLENALRNGYNDLSSIAPLSDNMVAMAMEFKHIIERVWEPVGRSGVDAGDVAREMERYGYRTGGNLEGMPGIDPNAPMSDQVNGWMRFDGTAASVHPLDALVNMQKALSVVHSRVEIATSLGQLHSHRFLEPNKTVEQLRAEGWQRIDVGSAQRSGSLVGKYIDPDLYFPPYLLKEIPYLEETVKRAANTTITGASNTLMRYAVRPYDELTGILKSMQTIWNVSHHFASVMGEGLAIMLAGRNPAHALRTPYVLKAIGKLPELDDISFLDDHLLMIDPPKGEAIGAMGRTARYKTGTARIMLADGAPLDFSPQMLWSEGLKRGVIVTPRHSKDLMPGLGSDVGDKASRIWAAITTNRLNVLARADDKLGEFSALRDNFTRIGHFLAALESKTFKSPEEALAFAAREVNDYHPTMQTMTAFDQKIGRRVVMYYTWVKQMAFRVMASAMDTPALVTVPSKAQYNMAEANGLEPESIGKPIPSDPRIASYYEEGLLGPSMFGGFAPFSTADDLPIDPETGEPVTTPQMWGVSPNAPQIDALFTLFGGINTDETPQEALFHYANLLNAIPKTMIDLAWDSRVGGVGAPPSADPWKHIFSQTGAPYRIAGMLGLNEPKAEFSPEEQAGEQARLIANWFTGLRFTNYTNTTSAGVAQREEADRQKKFLESLGYTPEEIQEIRKVWKLALEEND